MKSMIQFVVFDWLDGFLKKIITKPHCALVSLNHTHLKLNMQCFIISWKPAGVPPIIVSDIK